MAVSSAKLAVECGEDRLSSREVMGVGECTWRLWSWSESTRVRSVSAGMVDYGLGTEGDCSLGTGRLRYDGRRRR